ncbi:Uncharacterised protein [Mycobacterium tuberculosis]|nr:Uncharacterised protein [Mycobacterium tuberculosis]
MAGAGGQDRDVSLPDFEILAVIAPEADQCTAARDAEHFVDCRMIVEVVKNTVPPGLVPAVRGEPVLDGLLRIIVVDGNRSLVE